MAKARFKTTFNRINPKLVFREQAATERPRRVAGDRANVEVTETCLSHTSKAQSFKTVFLGDANVGKTCLAKMYVERRVVDQTTNTIGFDHHVKEIGLEGGVKVKLQVWDTAGMEQFRNALITKYYRNTDGIIFVFDITKRESFESLENWVKEVRTYVANMDAVKMTLIGNMKDKEYARKVSSEEARAFANRYEMVTYHELSAKSIETIQILDGIFQNLAEEMIRTRERLDLTQSSSHRSGVISLSDDWELIEVPEDPIPHSVYSHQDASIRQRLRIQRSDKCLC